MVHHYLFSSALHNHDCQGFLVLEVIPPEHLEHLRAAFEALVERQRAQWSAEAEAAGTPDPWEHSAQPRLPAFDRLVDDNQTASAMEFCLGATTRGVCKQLMRADEVGNVAFFLMCSPQADHGPANWHRDIHPIDQGPLGGLQQDMLQNRAPGYIQWNISLYDDDVLWVIPGSHARANTAAEDAQLLENNRVPMPGAVQVKLRAGQGVCYTNMIFHWGSDYSSKFRRCIHLGMRAFGGPIGFPYVTALYGTLAERTASTKFLSPRAQAIRVNQEELFRKECKNIIAAFRAALNRDAACFGAALARLHPSPTRREVALVLLSKLAHKICRPHAPALASEEGSYGGDFTQDELVVPAFTAEELVELWDRFAPFEAQLQAEAEQFVPGFQSGPMSFYFHELPSSITVNNFLKALEEPHTVNGAKL
eukprot:SAG31_NODE_1113_length_9854_cov_2.770682_6_plen_422_part_00